MPPNEKTYTSVVPILGISFGVLSLSSCVLFIISTPLAIVGLVLCSVGWGVATERWQVRVSVIGLILSCIGLLIPVGFVVIMIITDPNEPDTETWGYLDQTNATAPMGPPESDVDPQDR